MTLFSILFVSGLIAAAVSSGIVSIDSSRRNVPTEERLRRTTAIGIVCFAGFLIPYLFSDQLGYIYFQLIKPQPLVSSPSEWVGVHLTAGFVIAGAIMMSYFVASRYPSSHER